jgi:hypothetical protein
MIYKIPTVIGIVLIFGYFFWDSFHDGSGDPAKITLTGADTLGRNWDAIAAEKDQKLAENAANSVAAELNSEKDDGNNLLLNPKDDPLYSTDPLLGNKENLNNYSTIESADGREIIIGNNEEEVDPEDRYISRHEKERRQFE